MSKMLLKGSCRDYMDYEERYISTNERYNLPVPFSFSFTSSSIYIFAFILIFMRLFWLLQTDVAHFILRYVQVSYFFFFPDDVCRVQHRWRREAATSPSIAGATAKEYRDSRAHEITHVNDNYRVQARWKDQLVMPRGERYVYLARVLRLVDWAKRAARGANKSLRESRGRWFARYRFLEANRTVRNDRRLSDGESDSVPHSFKFIHTYLYGIHLIQKGYCENF